MKYCLIALSIFASFFARAQNADVPASIYDIKFTALNGSVIDMAQYKGKKILIVNTPEERDYAAQYQELEELALAQKEHLVVIGILSEDFQIQPGSKKNPARPKNYNVTFPLSAKMQIRDENVAPLFQWLTQKKYNNFQDTELGWDFQKFLINENGQLVGVYLPRTKPNGPEILAAVQK